MESWWPLSAWLSPGAALFVFCNVLVGVIAVMSRGQQGGNGRRLCRSASSMVLDRLRSFSMFTVHPAAECYDDEQLAGTAAAPVQEQATAAPPTPSAQPVTTTAADAAESISETRRSEVEAAEKSTVLGEADAQGQQHHAHESSSPATNANAAVETTAVVERPEPAIVEPESSKRRARACGREAEGLQEGKAEFNARAELFIHQFREDLKLQRLNSIVNYTRALRRRAGAALGQD